MRGAGLWNTHIGGLKNVSLHWNWPLAELIHLFSADFNLPKFQRCSKGSDPPLLLLLTIWFLEKSWNEREICETRIGRISIWEKSDVRRIYAPAVYLSIMSMPIRCVPEFSFSLSSIRRVHVQFHRQKVQFWLFNAIISSGWTRLFSSLQRWRLLSSRNMNYGLSRRAALPPGSDQLWSFSRKLQIYIFFSPSLRMNDLCGSPPSAADQSAPNFKRFNGIQMVIFGHSAPLWLPPRQVIGGENLPIIASFERVPEIRFETCIALAHSITWRAW